jgi:hypothetical protein
VRAPHGTLPAAASINNTIVFNREDFLIHVLPQIMYLFASTLYFMIHVCKKLSTPKRIWTNGIRTSTNSLFHNRPNDIGCGSTNNVSICGEQSIQYYSFIRYCGKYLYSAFIIPWLKNATNYKNKNSFN